MWLVHPDDTTVLQCFPSRTTVDQTEREPVQRTKTKHTHKFSTRMHDVRCVFDVDSCPLLSQLTRAAVCQTRRRDGRAAPSCCFPAKRAERTGEAQKCLILSVTENDVNLFSDLFVSFLLYKSLTCRRNSGFCCFLYLFISQS